MRNLFILLFVFVFAWSPSMYAQSHRFEELKNLEIIDLIYQRLDKHFVEQPNIGKITKIGIDAMLDQLDPYTVYYPQSDIEDYRLMTTGQYGGIGALIRRDSNYVVIAEPYKNMPAYNAGLRAGDKILSIDGHDMENASTKKVSEALKGPKGTTIKVKYQRPNKGIHTVEVNRDEIKMKDIPYFGMVDKTHKIGYIRLRSFTRTASANVIKAFKNLKEKGMKKLIFDLRGNGGGLLSQAINIVNIFVPKNTTIVTTKGRVLSENKNYKTRHSALDLDIPVVVLVNGGTASASEIVSGSLQDLDRGVVVGTNSFGKGLVQRTYDLKYGAKMKLTVAKYYTPSGRCVQKLEYYHNHDAEEVPDSLIQVFHTKNGRKVIDGRGIYPDVKVKNGTLARITAALIGHNIVFDFATQYAQQHTSISDPMTFKISDSLFNRFIEYALQQHFEYESATQIQLEKLLKVAKREGYAEEIKKQYEALHDALDLSKKEEMQLFKKQICQALSAEIVSRFYFQKGRVENTFQTDKQFHKAIDLLNNMDKYHALLQPPSDK